VNIVTRRTLKTIVLHVKMTFPDTRKNIAADSDPTSAVQLTKLAIGIQMKTINPFARIALTNAPAQGRYFDFSSCRKYSNTAFRNPLTFARLRECVAPFTETRTRNADSLIGRVLRAVITMANDAACRQLCNYCILFSPFRSANPLLNTPVTSARKLETF